MGKQEKKVVEGWLSRGKRLKCWMASGLNEPYFFLLKLALISLVTYLLIGSLIDFFNSLLPEVYRINVISYSILFTLLSILFFTLTLIIWFSGNDYIIYTLSNIITDVSINKMDMLDTHFMAVRRAMKRRAEGYENELFNLNCDSEKYSIEEIFDLIKFKIVADSSLNSTGQTDKVVDGFAEQCYHELYHKSPTLKMIFNYYQHLFSTINIKYIDSLFSGTYEEPEHYWGITKKDIVLMLIYTVVALLIGWFFWRLTGFS